MLNLAPHPSVYVPRTRKVLTAIVNNRTIEPSALERLLRRVPPDLLPKLLAHRALYGGTTLYATVTIAAPYLQVDFIIQIHAGAKLDLDGGAFRNPFNGRMCSWSSLGGRKILTSRGATICYRKDSEMVSALRAAKHFPDIKRWLLVGTFEGTQIAQAF